MKAYVDNSTNIVNVFFIEKSVSLANKHTTH